MAQGIQLTQNSTNIQNQYKSQINEETHQVNEKTNDSKIKALAPLDKAKQKFTYYSSLERAFRTFISVISNIFTEKSSTIKPYEAPHILSNDQANLLKGEIELNIKKTEKVIRETDNLMKGIDFGNREQSLPFMEKNQGKMLARLAGVKLSLNRTKMDLNSLKEYPNSKEMFSQKALNTMEESLNTQIRYNSWLEMYVGSYLYEYG